MPYSEAVNGRTWKAWLVPGGLLLALAAALVNSSLFAQVAPSLPFYYFGGFAAGLLLDWRFNSSRVLFSLLVLLVAHRAVDFFAAGQINAGSVHTGPGRTAVALAALLVPLHLLVLAASLIETSYVLAYHDELTGIRGRRAFNESLLSLDHQYAIAIVDIDHFKKFNDTYGHDVGDQVLCLVAKRLSQVGGDGQAFRCGGEEFAIVFRNTSAKEAFEHLDSLRLIVEKSTFQVRGSERRAERRAEKRSDSRNDLRKGEADRRKPARRKTASASPSPSPDRLSDHLSVTVSIGVAEPSTRYRQPEQVIQAADQALYRAKNKGRNRVELASTAPLRLAEGKRAKASRF